MDASRIAADTGVVFGLGMAGDDGMDLISYLRSATGTQLSEYDFYKHFGPEAACSMHGGEPLTVAQLVKLVEAGTRRTLTSAMGRKRTVGRAPYVTH